jgi:hypothetical protein
MIDPFMTLSIRKKREKNDVYNKKHTLFCRTVTKIVHNGVTISIFTRKKHNHSKKMFLLTFCRQFTQIAATNTGKHATRNHKNTKIDPFP